MTIIMTVIVLQCMPRTRKYAGHIVFARVSVGRTDRYVRVSDVRSTDVGRTDDAKCWLNMGDWQTFTSTKKCDTQCGRQVHMVRGVVPWECLQKRKLDR